MAASDVTRQAVLRAIAEHDELGRDSFLAKYGFGPATKYGLLVEGRQYDPKAILGAAHGFLPDQGGPLDASEFSGGEANTNHYLRHLGFDVIPLRPSSVEDERQRRLGLWSTLQSHPSWPDLGPQLLRDLGIYGGAQGIWVDVSRTRSVNPEGITVSVLHTGTSYADDLTDDGILYHYPLTRRPRGRDAAEVQATKTAAVLRLPVFVISKPGPNSTVRHVREAYVKGWDDGARVFLFAFTAQPPEELIDHDQSDDHPFELTADQPRARRLANTRRGQQAFRLQVLQRYGPVCAVSGIAVAEMVEAAHLRGVEHGGSNDPRNGLVLSAAHHRAFDAHLFAIEPSTLEIVIAPSGPSAHDLGLRYRSIAHLAKKPHPEALAWRWSRFLHETGQG